MLGMSRAAIEVRDLHKAYGPLNAVDGLTVDVADGEIFAFLGPNGAGKTVTVEILEGYRQRSSGSVRVLGEDPASAGARLRSRIGIVLQTSKIADEVTVGEVVRHFAGFYPRPRDPDDVIELVGLTDRRGSRVARLSGGQQRRLDVALGIVGRPDLLFLDEPTTGFDPEARRQFWGLIEQLRAEGTTILLTTHYLEEAEVLADRVGVIARGQLLAIGPPATLGGRAEASATVRWVASDGPHEIVTPVPTKVVAELAAGASGELAELTVSRPSLEDVYLSMIGTPMTGTPMTDTDQPPAGARR